MKKIRFPDARPESSDQFLYHYTTPEAALKHIFPTGALRAQSFVHMNDPREAKEWRFAAIGRIDDNADPSELAEYNESADRRAHDAGKLAQQSVRVLAFSTDIEVSDSAINPESVNLRGFAHPAMWWHYGQRHAGVCLVLDRNLFSSAVEQWAQREENRAVRDGIFHGAVTYKERWWPELPIKGTSHVFDDGGRDLRMETFSHLRRFWRELFLEKSTCWSYEYEYRWLFMSHGSEPFYIPIGDALVGIVIGEDFGKNLATGEVDSTAFQTLDLACRRWNISAKQVWWSNGVTYLGARNWMKRKQ